jgi:hypothetical protein
VSISYNCPICRPQNPKPFSFPDSYSKTKGLFAGISIEGSVLLQRKDANEAKYGKGVTGDMIVTGKVPRPPGAEPLYTKLAELDAKAAANAKAAAAKMAPVGAAPDL